MESNTFKKDLDVLVDHKLSKSQQCYIAIKKCNLRKYTIKIKINLGPLYCTYNTTLRKDKAAF